MLGWGRWLRSTDSEAARRHDMVTRLRTRCDQMGSLLNRPAERNSLLAGLAAGAPAVETEQTAELDNRGLILMQRELMRGEWIPLATRPVCLTPQADARPTVQRVATDQDDQLEDLSTLVSSTKHISLAIGEEVGLQNRLLVRPRAPTAASHAQPTKGAPAGVEETAA